VSARVLAQVLAQRPDHEPAPLDLSREQVEHTQ
jgi:hypothetical protein